MGRSGGGVGAGGREGVQAPPVNEYRKRIGRQDSKKEKQHLKDVKRSRDNKENAPTAYKESFLILLTVFAAFGVIYAILYLALQKRVVMEETFEDK